MTPRQIEVFQAVMKTGSITAAAARLNVSQPSVSKQVQLLEDSIGFALFRRSGNRLLATHEAERLFERVEAVYTGLDDVRRFAHAIRDNRTGSLSIAAMPLLAQFWLPPLIARVMQPSGPFLSLPVRSTDWIMRAAAAGRIDIGVCLSGSAGPGIKTMPLMALPFVCVMPPNHRLSTQTTVDLDDLSGEPVVRLNSFENNAHADRILPEFTSNVSGVDVFTTAAACEIVAAGFGVTIVDAITARAFERRGLLYRPVATVPPLDLSLVTPDLRPPTRLAASIRDQILEFGRTTQRTLSIA